MVSMDLLLLLLMVVMMGIMFDEFGYIMGFVLKKSSVSERAWDGKYPQTLAVSPGNRPRKTFPIGTDGNLYSTKWKECASFVCKSIPNI